MTSLALLCLAACDYQGHRITAVDDDPQAAVMAQRAPVTLPPAIMSSATYRCTDNSLIYVDFFTDDRVMVREGSDGAPTILAGEADHGSYSGSGYRLARTAGDVRFTSPGLGARLCHSSAPPPKDARSSDLF